MDAGDKSIGDQPDDFLALFVLHAIWSSMFIFKVIVGVLSIPLVVLMWLHGLGSRTINAACAFVNPES